MFINLVVLREIHICPPNLLAKNVETIFVKTIGRCPPSAWHWALPERNVPIPRYLKRYKHTTRIILR